jgi:membrane protease YdiL (CAAX protease family)
VTVAGAAAAPQGRLVDLGGTGVLAPGRLRWLRALGWCVAMFLLVVLAGSAAAALGYLALALAEHEPMSVAFTAARESRVVPFVLMAAAALAAYVGLVRLAEKRRPDELAPRFALRELGLGLAAGAAMMAVTVLILWLGGWDRLSEAHPYAIWQAIGISVESGTFEEILFRLIILRLLWRAFGPWAALALSALLFGTLHLANPHASWFAAIAIAVEAGLMLAAFYILTGRLWMSMGVHAGWNFTQGWVFGAAVSGTSDFAGGPLMLQPAPGAPEALSGGGFGPEASLAGLAVGTAVGAALLYRAWQRGRFAAGE